MANTFKNEPRYSLDWAATARLINTIEHNVSWKIDELSCNIPAANITWMDFHLYDERLYIVAYDLLSYPVISRIDVYELDGTFDFSFSQRGSTNDDLYEPRGIFVYDDEIYVSEITANSPYGQIKVFDLSGNYVRKFGTVTDCKYPNTVYVDSGFVYVAWDGLNREACYRISKFTTAGGLLSTWGGGPGFADNEFHNISTLEVYDGEVFTTDGTSDTGRIKVTDTLGGFRRSQEKTPNTGLEFIGDHGKGSAHFGGFWWVFNLQRLEKRFPDFEGEKEVFYSHRRCNGHQRGDTYGLQVYDSKLYLFIKKASNLGGMRLATISAYPQTNFNCYGDYTILDGVSSAYTQAKFPAGTHNGIAIPAPEFLVLGFGADDLSAITHGAITDSDLTIDLRNSGATGAPSTPWYAKIDDEIVKVSIVNVDTPEDGIDQLSITRAQLGTIALAHDNYSLIHEINYLNTPGGALAFDLAGLVTPEHIGELRTSIESLAGVFKAVDNYPAIDYPYNWIDADQNNAMYNLMGNRTDYGATGGAAYDWTRTLLEMVGTPTYDLDIGEVYDITLALYTITLTDIANRLTTDINEHEGIQP